MLCARAINHSNVHGIAGAGANSIVRSYPCAAGAYACAVSSRLGRAALTGRASRTAACVAQTALTALCAASASRSSSPARPARSWLRLGLWLWVVAPGKPLVEDAGASVCNQAVCEHPLAAAWQHDVDRQVTPRLFPQSCDLQQCAAGLGSCDCTAVLRVQGSIAQAPLW